jgi:hypothetical protein
MHSKTSMAISPVLRIRICKDPKLLAGSGSEKKHFRSGFESRFESVYESGSETFSRNNLIRICNSVYK